MPRKWSIKNLPLGNFFYPLKSNIIKMKWIKNGEREMKEEF